jgi:hypothetical protein
MKLVKTASGKNKIKLSKSEWENIGKTAGWMRKALGPQKTSQPMGTLMEKSPMQNVADNIVGVIRENNDIIYKLINYRLDGDERFEPLYDERSIGRESLKLWKQLKPLFDEFKSVYNKSSDHNVYKQKNQPLYAAITNLEEYIQSDSDIGHVFHDMGLEDFLRASNISINPPF